MKLSFALAALIGAALAGPGNLRTGLDKRRNDPKFLEFASRFNRDVREPLEFDRRQANFRSADEKISA